MEQLKYINVAEVLQNKGTSHEELFEFKMQTNYSYRTYPTANEIFLAESKGEKFISIPSDDFKELIVRVEDIVNVYVIKNPEYKEESVE